MPFVHARQVLGAPITKKKLLENDTERNLLAVRRYVLKCWIECGRQKTLVICQKDIVESAKGAKDRLAKDMPDSIHFEWFNNVAGLDEYKDVRLLITIGRVLPKPFEVEAAAGLLSGVRPVEASVQANGGTWFDRVQRGIRLRGSATGPAVWCDQHPDPLAEAVRWQICEAELIQAIGRGRGVNRTKATPLDAEILADVVLPIEVDQVEEWRLPGREVEMAAEGIWLESPTDMATSWPEVWATAKAAERSPESLNRESYKGKWGSVRYQRSGPNQNWKEAFYDPDVIPDPRGWLEDRVGPLAGFEIERRVESEQGKSRAIERVEVDIDIPGGRRVTLEHLVIGGEAVVGRVAVTCFMNPRALSPDTRPAWAHARF
jgi:putative DNA primase/helicase